MELGAYVMTDTIFNQIDDDANDIFLFKEIIGHEYDSMALTKEEKKTIDDLQLNNGTIIRNQNNIHPLYITRRWKILLNGRMVPHHGCLLQTSRTLFLCIWQNLQ